MRSMRRGARFCLTALAIMFVAGCAGDLDNVDEFLDEDGNIPAEFRDQSGDDGSGDAGDDGQTPDSGCVDNPPAFLNADATSCTGCHVESNPTLWAGLDLSADGLEERVTNAPSNCPEGLIADPADPEASTLVVWVRGGVEGCDESRMPLIGAPLTDEEIECLVQWIDGLDGTIDLGPGTSE
ncbi:MAG: hypothetical protein AAFP04_07095 [Myxococcota bacterium]